MHIVRSCIVSGELFAESRGLGLNNKFKEHDETGITGRDLITSTVYIFQVALHLYA